MGTDGLMCLPILSLSSSPCLCMGRLPAEGSAAATDGSVRGLDDEVGDVMDDEDMAGKDDFSVR